ncbi:MAG: hypothetical protein IPN13_12380 [Bacteroidetes bacterium]|nr:hypothetical protein [Bacteroidota bacterium]
MVETYQSHPVCSGKHVFKHPVSNVWNITYESLLDGNGSASYVFVTKPVRKLPHVFQSLLQQSREKVE